MPTITVSAADSATAMDQIVAQLGKDAMIIDTTTRDGKLEIRATNDVALKLQKPKQISDVFAQIMQDELNPPQAGDKARSAFASNAATTDSAMDKLTVNEFWNDIEIGDGETDSADEAKERETENNIRMRRLQWENERLVQEAKSLRDLSRESVETAKNYFEKSEQQNEETKQTLTSFRDELVSLRETMNERKQTLEKKSFRRRVGIVALAGVMVATAGAFTFKEQRAVILPWVDTIMSTIGASVTVSMDYFRVSDLEAERLGDTIRVKGTVTNNFPLSVDAPVIRFIVQDDQGVMLSERDVEIDLEALRPGQSSTVTAQLELATWLDDSMLTDIIAVPVERASLATGRDGSGT